ncbi:MAG: 3-deoxy-8-phosphooctulonate synthase [Phycisphaeraceae bacterium]
MTTKTLHVGAVPIGPDQPLTIIAGPCVAESRDLCLQIGQTLRDRCQTLGLGYIFKASFDKANRSSIHSDRGPGLDEGLRLLEEVKAALGVPVTTDVHESHQCRSLAVVVDLLQIPAFLCRQTDLLVAAAQTGRPVNVKKGQFLSPQEMGNVVRKLEESAADKADGEGGIMLTERGTFFGYHRLVNDFVGVADMLDLGHPVCFDVTHSTQQPGGQGNSSGGRPERAPMLARCAIAAGVHALFLETHPDPAHAVSDAATMLPLDRTLPLLDELARLHHAMGSIRS